MTTSEKWKQSSPLTLEKIEFVYQMLIDAAESPMEAAVILSAVLTRLWINGSADDGDINSMLTSFCDTVKLNVERGQNV